MLIGWLLSLNKYTNKEIKRICTEVHSGRNYYQVKIDKLRKFLRAEGIDTNAAKLKLLIEYTEKSAEEYKYPFIISRGTFFSVTFPIIVTTVGYVLNRHVEKLEIALLASSGVIVILTIVLIYTSLIKKFIFDELINGDYQRLKTIANDLRELYFKEV
jgi:hypothetical protein